MATDEFAQPVDEFNRELVRNAHPPQWANPTPARRYNLVVIGAGTAGLVSAAFAAGMGAKVALVERHLFGGDCLNVGCVPSKCLIRCSRAAADVRDAERFGVRVPQGAEVDFPAVMERMRRLRARISRHDAVQRFAATGVDVFLGEGRFTGLDTVEVGGAGLRFKRAIIATGARAFDPPVPGLAEAGYLTNETVFNLTERPARLAVIGAGPLGCELAQAFQRLGSRVTVVEKTPQLLPREDPDTAAVLAAAFERDGVRVRLSSECTRVSRRGKARVIHLSCDAKDEELEVDEVLVGAGRAPNVQGLGLEAAAVAYDERRGVHVDDLLRTSNRNILAAGDICLKHKFTHTADATARIAVQNALVFRRQRLSALTIPWCTYTDPEIAHVGLYEAEAAERGMEVDTFKQDFAEVDRAIADGEIEGFVKVHVKKGTDRILGATIMARHAGEMISEVTAAMVGGIGLGSLSGVIHPYPTQADAIRMAADAYNRTWLTPFVRSVLRRLMAWRRA
jgi:pyruvate/2-oxoglutarate dehydrogenase complex dihydrolipoamide dehydrogenase (E3) component